MQRVSAAVLLMCAISLAQAPAPVPDTQVPQRKQILTNHHVTVSMLELAPKEATPMHQHAHDMITVVVNGGETHNKVFGQKVRAEKLEAGEVRFRKAGYAHAVENEGTEPFRAVIVDFADPQANLKKMGTSSHSCNPENKTCIDEKNLFCTAKVCVQDVTMAPGAATSRHTHATDHMMIAVSDYELTDEAEGKAAVVRSKKSGEVEYIAAGITHKLTNTGKAPAHFTVIVWR